MFGLVWCAAFLVGLKVKYEKFTPDIFLLYTWNSVKQRRGEKSYEISEDYGLLGTGNSHHSLAEKLG